MKNAILSLFFLCLLSSIQSQEFITGYVHTDENDPEGTIVVNTATNDFYITEEDAYYEVEGSIGDHLVFSRLGYESIEVLVESLEGESEVFMKRASFELPTVVVSAIRRNTMSTDRRCLCQKNVSSSLRSPTPIASVIHTYPNPTSGELRINSSEVHMVEVFSINGAQINQYRLDGEKNLNISAYPAGTYILRCANQDGLLVGNASVVKMD